MPKITTLLSSMLRSLTTRLDPKNDDPLLTISPQDYRLTRPDTTSSTTTAIGPTSSDPIKAVHTCELVEKHRIMLPVWDGGFSAVVDAAHDLAMAWAKEVGVEMRNVAVVRSHRDLEDVHVGVEFSLTLGKSIDDLITRTEFTWSDRAKAWALPFARLAGRAASGGRIGVSTASAMGPGYGGGAGGGATSMAKTSTGARVIDFPENRP